LHQFKLTVITALKYLVHLPADVIPLEEKKVSTIALVLEAIRRDVLMNPKIRLLRHPCAQFEQLRADAHVELALDLVHPSIVFFFFTDKSK
jgi:hypothetical protein